METPSLAYTVFEQITTPVKPVTEDPKLIIQQAKQRRQKMQQQIRESILKEASSSAQTTTQASSGTLSGISDCSSTKTERELAPKSSAASLTTSPPPISPGVSETIAVTMEGKAAEPGSLKKAVKAGFSIVFGDSAKGVIIGLQLEKIG